VADFAGGIAACERVEDNVAWINQNSDKEQRNLDARCKPSGMALFHRNRSLDAADVSLVIADQNGQGPLGEPVQLQPAWFLFPHLRNVVEVP
jgi:hypothetical protein